MLLPAELGLVSALLLASGGRADWDDSALAGALAGILWGCILFPPIKPGLVLYLLVSLPLLVPLAIAGAGMGHAIQESFWDWRGEPAPLR